MNIASTALGVVLATALAATATQASAQQPAAQAEAVPDVKPSKGAYKAIADLQKAINGNETAKIPTLIAEANAVATTPDDRYIVAALRYRVAIAAKDDAAKAAALEAMLASGKMSPANALKAQLDLGSMAYNAKDYDRAAAAYERVIASDPNNLKALVLLGESRHAQNRTGEALGHFRSAIAKSKAAGTKAEENWYKRAVALAYEAKSPEAITLARDWAVAYPSKDSWRESIAVYRNLQRPPEGILIDALRLSRTVGALQGEADYHPLAYLTLQELSPAEAKAVVEEGIAAGEINGNSELFREIMAEANSKSAGQKARLAELARDGLAAPTSKVTLNAANIHYGQGEFATAADLYRAALSKPGADKDLVNLRLGMSLARAGDKAGATAALNAVTGARAEVAKFWLAYLQTRA